MKQTYVAPAFSREGTLAELTAGSRYSSNPDGGVTHTVPSHTLLETTTRA